MHYQHQFHAGNFADVVKHVTLHRILRLLARKPTPWCVVDTHAGAGTYPLGHPASARTGEWRDGIGRFVAVGDDAPEPVRAWLADVEACNGGPLVADRPPRLYPGSPWLAAAQARDQDRVVLFEQASDVCQTLRDELQRMGSAGARCAVHARDGFEAWSLLPPPERRGLLLIDPPFERPDEFSAIESLVARTLQRFAHGIVAVWYPAKKHFDHQRFVRRLRAAHPQPMLTFTLETGAPSEGQMHACGMLVINPPYPLQDDLQALAPWLAKRLAQGRGATAQVQALSAESPASPPRPRRERR